MVHSQCRQRVAMIEGKELHFKGARLEKVTRRSTSRRWQTQIEIAGDFGPDLHH